MYAPSHAHTPSRARMLALLCFVGAFFICFGISTPKADAAIGTGGATCTVGSKTTGTTLTCTVATEAIEVGNVAVLVFGGDNLDNGGNTKRLSSVTDTGGNTWMIRRCFSSSHAAAGGTMTCIATAKITTQLSVGNTITATFDSIDAKGMVLREFTVGSGNGLVVAGSPQDLSGTADPAAMSITGLPNTDYLFIRAVTFERASNTTWTVTSNYTTMTCNGTTGGGAASNIEACGEYRIVTATTTGGSDPTGTAVDHANIFLALTEASSTISGTLYSDEGVTQITSGKTIKLARMFDGQIQTWSTTTDSSAGTWRFNLPIALNASSSLVFFVDGDATTRASLFTRGTSTASSTSVNLSGLTLYLNHVIVSNEATTSTSTTIADLGVYDNDNDTDLQYNASSTTSTLVVQAYQRLYIAPNKIFTASGTVTVRGAASSTSQTDGSLHIASGATFYTIGTTTLAGSFTASSSANYMNPNEQPIIFNATTTGKTIRTTLSTLGPVIFNGSGGGWTMATTSTTTNLTLTAGTLTAPSTNLTITGTYTNNGGTFTHNSGTTTFAGLRTQVATGTATGTSAFNHVEVASASTTWSSAAVEVNLWYSVTYGNGLFVAVSYDGTNRVMTSPDGITWTARTAAEQNQWYSVTYGNGLFVAVAGGGTNRVMTSPDGITWTARTPVLSLNYQSVTYGNGLFVAIAQGTATLVTSPDGITWTARSGTAANTWMSVTYGNGLFVAVSYDATNRVMTSPDGITWTARSAAGNDDNWYSITYGNGLFVAVGRGDGLGGGDRVMTSPDGITWTARSAAEANTWYSVTYGNGLFVAVSSDGTNRVMTSPDGVAWAVRAASEANQWYSVTYGNGLFVAVAGSGGTNRVMTSLERSTAFTFGKSASTTNLSIGSGATVTVPAAFSISGQYNNQGTFLAGIGTTTFNGTSAQTVTGTMTGTSAFYTAEFVGAGTKTFGAAASSTGDFTISASASVVAPSSTITIGGNFTQNGTFMNNGGTTTFVGFNTVATGTLTGTSALNNVSIALRQGNIDSFAIATDTNQTNILAFAIDATNGVLYIGTDPSGIIYRCVIVTGCDSTDDLTIAYDTPESSIYSLVIDTTNSVLYAGSSSGGIIYRCVLSTACDAAGDFTTAYDTTEGDILALNIDSTNGVLYAGTFPNAIIYRCVLSTACDAAVDFTTAYDTTAAEIDSFLVDTTNSVLYVGTGSGGIIYRCVLSTACDAAGDFTTAYDTPESYIFSLVIDTTNSVLYAGSSSGGIIYRCALSTACDAAGDFTTAYDTSETRIFALAIDIYNNVLYAGTDANGIIYRCVLSTACDAAGDFTTAYDTPETSVRSLVIDNQSGAFFVGTNSNGIIYSRSNKFTFGSRASTTNFLIQSNSSFVAPSTSLSISGNYTNNGTFNANGGTTTFNGTSAQTATGTMTGTSAFNALEVTNTSATTTFGSTTTATRFRAVNGGTILAFPGGATTTFTTATISGASGNELWIRSSTNNTQASLVVSGAYTLTYLNVKDSNACGSTGGGLTVTTAGTDVSNNTCWTIPAGTVAYLLSGSLYLDHGQTLQTSAKTLGIAIGTSTVSVHATTSLTSGAWNFTVPTGHSISSSTPILIWVDGDATMRAALLTKASSTTSIGNLDLYRDRLIVRHEGTSGTSTNLTDLGFYDGDNDTDIQYTSNNSALTVFANTLLTVATNTTFVASGTVTVRGSASASTTDGSLHLSSGSTFYTTGTTTLAGSFTASSSATYTAPTSTLVFNATTTGKTITAASLATLGTTTFDGVSGSWTFATTATTSNLTIATSTARVNTAYDLTITGNLANDGALIQSAGTTTFSSANNLVISGTSASSTFNHITMTGAGEKRPDLPLTATGNFLNDTGSTFVASSTLTVGGHFTQNGTLRAPADTAWTARSAAESNSWQSVTHGNGLFVAVAYSGTNRVMTSPDGITWATSSAAEANQWQSITYGNGLFVAVSQTGTNRVMTSSDGTTWATTSAAGNNDQWLSITYGNGLFVAVGTGDGGSGGDRVMTSPDGTNWTARSAAGDNDGWRSVTYGNGLFVAVSSFGDRVMTSSDGTTWATTSAAGNDDTWYSVTYGNGLFVTVGTSGDRVMTSPDGTNWTARSAAGNDDYWQSITYGNGLFVAISCGGGTSCGTVGDRVMTSPDGTNWTARSAAGDDDSWRSVIYRNGLFVAVGSLGTRVMTSPVGHPVALNGTSAQTISGTLTESSFLTGGILTKESGTKMLTSAASTTDLTIATTSGAVSTAYSLSVNNAYTNGSTFTQTGGTTTFSGVTQVASGTATFNNLVLSGDGHKTFFGNATTTNLTVSSGTTFNQPPALTISGTYQNTGTTTAQGGVLTARSTARDDDSWTSVTYGNGLFVAVGTSGDRVMTSPDGITWATTSAAGNDDTWYSVTYGNGLFVAVGDSTGTGDSVMTSPDGTNWTLRSAAGDNDLWYEITYGNGLFVAMSQSGDRVMTSSDGTTWATTSAAGNDDTWTSVTYGNGLFVAVGTSGDRVMTSPDGTTWTARSVAGNDDLWRSVTYGNGLFVAVSCGGSLCGSAGDRVMTSPIFSTTTFSGTNQSISGTLTGSSALGNVVLAGSGTKTFGSNASTSNLRIDSGVTMTAPTSLTIFGDYTNSGTFTAGSGTTTFPNDGAQTLSGTMTDTSAWNNLVFSGNATKTIASNASTTNLVNGTSATTSTSSLVLPTKLSIAGTFSQLDRMVAGSGTTTMNGTSAQTATGTLAFNNLEITNNTATTTFMAPFTGAHLALIVPTTTVAFAANGTTTVSSLTVSGATSTARIKLRSSVPGTKFGFNLGSGSYTVAYADVKDSSGTSTSGNIQASYSVDSGNTNGWSFLTASGNATISGGANQTFALNYPTTTINTITVTDDATNPSITTANDLRITIATSSVAMRWDTTDTTATFGGTAGGKVSNPVSYEGDGSVLLITVTENWSAGDTLTIDGLSFSQFTAINAAASGIGVRAGGPADTTNDATDDKTITITGSLTMANHPQTQVNDKFQGMALTGTELFRYTLTPQGEDITITTTTFTLTGVNGVNQDDLSNFTLYRDLDDDGTYSTGDVAVGGAGALSVSGQSGTITFSSSYSATTSQAFVLIGDVAQIRPGDMLTISLPTSGLTGTGVVSVGTVPPVGTVSRIQHVKAGAGSVSGRGEVGGAPPAGDGIRGGGTQQGGGEIDTDTGGDTLGNELNFYAPTSHGTGQSAWTNGGDGYHSDGTYATAAGAGLRHTYGNFGFSVPGGNQITGIVVKLEAAATTNEGTIDVKLSWDGGTALTSAHNTGTLTTTDAVYTVGGQTDTWGRSWTPSEFGDSTFAIEVIGNPSGNTLKIDAIRVRVYHQSTGGSQGGGNSEVSLPLPQRYAGSAYTEYTVRGNTVPPKINYADLREALEMLREALGFLLVPAQNAPSPLARG